MKRDSTTCDFTSPLLSSTMSGQSWETIHWTNEWLIYLNKYFLIKNNEYRAPNTLRFPEKAIVYILCLYWKKQLCMLMCLYAQMHECIWFKS